MGERRWLIAVVLLSSFLHAAAISRSTLPAQDGLKFIRVARQFQTQPWGDVIRGTDQHPLYPALIATVEPMIASSRGADHGADTWRISAQFVAAAASLLLIAPLYRLTSTLFDSRVATLAVSIFALLPLPAGWGRETLADSVGLCALMFSLQLGAQGIRLTSWRAAVGSGIAAGLGYLARPEIILAPVAIGLWFLFDLVYSRFQSIERDPKPAFAALLLGALLPVGCYALIKGEVSEKLALRYATSRIERPAPIRKVPQWLPAGLDDPRWDFSAKEESEGLKISGWRNALTRILSQWWRELAGVFAVMTIWGLVRQRFIRSLIPGRDPEDASPIERGVLLTFLIVYIMALARHSCLLGYLSDRHTLALVLVSTPWAAAGTFVCLRGLAVKFGWSPQLARGLRTGLACLVIVTIIYFQMRTTHSSRSGHLDAGRWLATHAQDGESVLDTRGWATFIADKSPAEAYDYWHVRQALTDRRLSYLVVESAELEADSDRARTLKAVLAYAAEPIREFRSACGSEFDGVLLYRFRRPDDWKGLIR